MKLFKQSILAMAVMIPALSVADTHTVISQANDRDALSITIYNQSLALINETRHIPIKLGLNTIEFRDVSAQIRPETALLSAHSEASFHVIEQNFDYDLLSPQTLLNKAVGAEIEIIKRSTLTGDDIRENAILLANNGQPVLKFDDRIEIGPFDSFAFKTIPDDLRDQPTLSILLDSRAQNTQSFQLSYLTHGFTWKADYNATLSNDEQFMDMTGLITLNNHSGTSFNNAYLQLVAGDVNQVKPSYNGEMRQARAASSVVLEMDATQAVQENFGDYHLYKIPFATALKNQQTKQISLLSAKNIPVTKEYRFNEYYSYTTKDDQSLKASVLFRINNTKQNQLGMPLPKGTFRIYQNDTTGNAVFIGEDTIEHTAENESFIVKTGHAFDVSLTKKLTAQRNIAKGVSQYSYEVTFNNAKEETVTVNYVSYIPNYFSWEVFKSSLSLTSTSGNNATWTVKIPAKSSANLTYTLQINSQ